MDFVARPVFGEACAGYLLLDDEFHRGIRHVAGQIAQMDEIEHVADFIELVLIVRSFDDRSSRKLTIVKVLDKETVRVLAKPLQRMPVIIGGRGTHAAPVTEVGQADDMSADCRERGP